MDFPVGGNPIALFWAVAILFAFMTSPYQTVHRMKGSLMNDSFPNDQLCKSNIMARYKCQEIQADPSTASNNQIPKEIQDIYFITNVPGFRCKLVDSIPVCESMEKLFQDYGTCTLPSSIFVRTEVIEYKPMDILLVVGGFILCGVALFMVLLPRHLILDICCRSI
jgi:hypothetical protein